ncbi:MAG: Fe-S cluster assembly protein SufB, partial [Anaeroplasmataceae bacterium]
MSNTKNLVGDYKYGFKTETKSVLEAKKGLNEDVVRFISSSKQEPSWMLDFRLKAYKSFLKQKNPNYGPDLSDIDY